MTQTERVLQRLRWHPQSGITALEAQQLIGTMRLAARINDLRALGHGITTTTVSQNGKHFARYTLVRDADAPVEGEQRALWGNR